MSCVGFLLQLAFSCGSTLDFDAVLIGWCDFDIVEFDVVLVGWCGFGMVDAGWW